MRELAQQFQELSAEERARYVNVGRQGDNLGWSGFKRSPPCESEPLLFTVQCCLLAQPPPNKRVVLGPSVTEA